LGSSRLPEKMVKKFSDGTCMVDHLLDKMVALKEGFDFQYTGIALHPGELELVNRALSKDVPIIFRSATSTSSGKLSEIFEFLRGVPCDYVMWLNGSVMNVDTAALIRAAEVFCGTPGLASMTSVKVRENWFWDANRNPLTVPRTGKTQDSAKILESTHAFHIFNKNKVLEDGRYWDLEENDPHLFVMDGYSVDVDHERDFRIADALIGG